MKGEGEELKYVKGQPGEVKEFLKRHTNGNKRQWNID